MLNALKDDPSITIKSADKGGAMVVMDTDLEVMHQLNDLEIYRVLPGDPQ